MERDVREVLKRFELSSENGNEEVSLDSIDRGDALWQEDFQPLPSYKVLYSNFYEIGMEVVDTYGNVGRVVGIEYLGHQRRPIVWVDYGDGIVTPELPESLTPIEKAKRGLFKILKTSLARIASLGKEGSKAQSEALNEELRKAKEGVRLPGSFALLSDIGIGDVRVFYLSHEDSYREVHKYRMQDTNYSIVLSSLYLKLPVALEWKNLVVPPYIALNELSKLPKQGEVLP